MTNAQRALLRTETISLPQLAILTFISCVFAAPAIAIFSFLVW